MFPPACQTINNDSFPLAANMFTYHRYTVEYFQSSSVVCKPLVEVGKVVGVGFPVPCMSYICFPPIYIHQGSWIGSSPYTHMSYASPGELPGVLGDYRCLLVAHMSSLNRLGMKRINSHWVQMTSKVNLRVQPLIIWRWRKSRNQGKNWTPLSRNKQYPLLNPLLPQIKYPCPSTWIFKLTNCLS